MKPRIIKTAEDYETALARIDALMSSDPAPETDDGAELELFSMLVEQYEDVHFPMDPPSPIDAIKFRMEQAGLKQADLVPMIGSKGKVSEVLNGKRSLSLNMIRRLHKELGIPAEILLRDSSHSVSTPKYVVSSFPMAEMLKRGYLNFSGSLQEAKEYGEELLADFLGVFGGKETHAVYCRRSENPINENSLLVWQARALHLVEQEKLPPFNREVVGIDFATTLAKLSYSETGPKTAVEFLNKKGIHVVFLKHLSKTYLDGASFLSPTGNPVVALSLRHDRLDNFWFTLLHELGHVYLHLNDSTEAFFDDTDNLYTTKDPKELEANQFAANALIPEDNWQKSRSRLVTRPTEQKAVLFAEALNIHSAVVAGRIRWERNDYKLLKDLIPSGKLKKMLNPNL